MDTLVTGQWASRSSSHTEESQYLGFLELSISTSQTMLWSSRCLQRINACVLGFLSRACPGILRGPLSKLLLLKGCFRCRCQHNFLIATRE